jgi:hypothetical protein
MTVLEEWGHDLFFLSPLKGEEKNQCPAAMLQKCRVLSPSREGIG